jgi:predicted nucleic acid-binding protein
MKKRVYIETTVVSYFTARPSRDLMIAGHQEATRELWPQLDNRYETYISALVYEEAGKGDREQAHTRLAAIKSFRMLDTDDEARVLAERIMAGKGIPQEHPEDALHIAVAAINGMDALVTWNFAHLNNPFTRMMIRQIVENEGFPCPEICSPEELLEADRWEIRLLKKCGNGGWNTRGDSEGTFQRFALTCDPFRKPRGM